MIIGIGLDLCSVEKGRQMLANERFLQRIFTEEEQAYFLSKGVGAAASCAGCFAVKEAVLKALGIGLRVSLQNIEVKHDASGAPQCTLTGKAKEIALSLGATSIFISITHEENMAAAVAVIEGVSKA